MYHTFIIHLSVNGHLYWFHFLIMGKRTLGTLKRKKGKKLRRQQGELGESGLGDGNERKSLMYTLFKVS